MAYDYARLFNVIVNAVQTDGALAGRMAAVIAECQAQRPHPDWDRLKALDFQSDAPALRRWLSLALSGPSFETQNYQGLWFGLMNFIQDDVVTADIYASATCRYAPPGVDWAESPTYVAEHSDLRSIVLNSIYRIAYDSEEGLENDAEYPLALAYGAMAACEALSQLRVAGHLSTLKGAACGFDDGDFLFLGAFEGGHFSKQVVAG